MASHGMKNELIARAAELHAVLARASASSPRLFGSVARGEDDEDSDVDILVEAGPDCSLLDLCRAEDELEDRFGRRFDLVTPAGLHPAVRSEAVAQAIPL